MQWVRTCTGSWHNLRDVKRFYVDEVSIENFALNFEDFDGVSYPIKFFDDPSEAKLFLDKMFPMLHFSPGPFYSDLEGYKNNKVCY